MKKKQIGRSMLEMIAVLAIIGVLSIAGTWGYQKAMLRYRLVQAQHWVEKVRFIISEACINGNSQGCFVDTNTGSDYKKRADYVCAQGGKEICPKELNSLYGSARSPLKESLLLLHMNDLNYLSIYFKDLDKQTCQTVINHDWNGLVRISNYTGWSTEKVKNGHKYLTQEQKNNLSAQCPFPQYIVLTFELQN